MNFYVKHSIPGRMRVAYNKYELTKRQVALAQNLLAVQEGIKDVSANFTTGTFLLYYDVKIQSERKIKALFKALSAKYLNDAELLASIEEPKDQDSLFGDLFWMALKHYAKFLLPPQLRLVLRVFGMGPRIARGLMTVANGHLFKADVLDATAIGFALLTGDSKTASNINFLLNIGDTIEDFTKKKSYGDLAKTMFNDNDKVQLVEGKTERSIPLKLLKEGNTVVVRTGALIPADGQIISGIALVNQASITGEPLAVERKEGQSVFAGTIVQEGELFINVRAVGSQTKIQNILIRFKIHIVF